MVEVSIAKKTTRKRSARKRRPRPVAVVAIVIVIHAADPRRGPRVGYGERVEDPHLPRDADRMPGHLPANARPVTLVVRRRIAPSRRAVPRQAVMLPQRKLRASLQAIPVAEKRPKTARLSVEY